MFLKAKHWIERQASRVVLVALLVALAPAWCAAGQINWRSPIAAANVISDGTTPMGSAFKFQLGSFAGGFVPDASNVLEWAGHWRVLDTTPYNGTTRFFSSSVILASNESPFTAGTSGYMWGFAPAGNGKSEWILMRSVRWRWPVATGGIAFPVDWEVDEAAIAIVGEVNGDTFLMKSAAVEAGVETEADAWLASKFTPEQRADPSVSGWNADPEGDGVRNLLEFTTGGDPLEVDSQVSASSWSTEESSGYELTIPVAEAARDAVTLTLQFSIHLDGWLNLPAEPIFDAGRVTFRVNPGNAEIYYRIDARLK